MNETQYIRESNVYKLRIARKIITDVLPLDKPESEKMMEICLAIDALMSLNGSED